MLKWSQHNHFQRIEDMLQVIPRTLLLVMYSKVVTIRSKLHDICGHFAFIFYIEPKNILETEGDLYWLLVMQEELNQFKCN